MPSKIYIRIGGQRCSALLENNDASKSFLKLLPLQLDMEDLNNNEKFASLPKKLPTQETSPGKIQAGDIMLWGNNTLVLFYKSFPTSYKYTILGRIEDPGLFQKLIGSGNMQVGVELP